MEPRAVVEHFDIIEDRGTRLRARGEAVMIGDLVFEAAPERATDPEIDKMIADLEASEQIHEIVELPRLLKEEGNQVVPRTTMDMIKSALGRPSGSLIRWDPDNWYGWDYRDPVIGLVHELKHSHDRDTGLFRKFQSVPVHGFKNGSEHRAVEMENSCEEP